MTTVQLAEFKRLQEENAKLREAMVRKTTLSYKVSEKGAMSVYGLGRFPVTLYREQWDRLFNAKPELEAFLVANASKFTSKADKIAAQATG